jgi:serine/threonine protein kinase
LYLVPLFQSYKNKTLKEFEVLILPAYDVAQSTIVKLPVKNFKDISHLNIPIKNSYTSTEITDKNTMLPFAFKYGSTMNNLNNGYILTDLIGKGDFSDIYLACSKDTPDKDRLVVKLALFKSSDDYQEHRHIKEYIACRVEREANLMVTINKEEVDKPNIFPITPTVIDIGYYYNYQARLYEDQWISYIIMTPVQGTLLDYLQEKDRTLNNQDIQVLVKQVETLFDKLAKAKIVNGDTHHTRQKSSSSITGLYLCQTQL